jgi:hypothetical protein
VEANRIWQHLFGVGLVETSEDFGAQGTRPSHPELLDWLASELMRAGWSRKVMIRLIVTSSTYRQSSRLRPDVETVDPDNRLLARQNRYRLNAESVRDQYLAASGLLFRQIGGPGFRPPLPEGSDAIGFKFQWPVDTGRQLHRRGMYIFLQRNLMYPMLITFDQPDATVTCTRRKRSNTPLQALTQLNDAIFMEAARELAQGVIVREQHDEARIRCAFQGCMGRSPSSQEMQVLHELLSRFRRIYHEDEQAARRLHADATTPTIAESDFAAWIALCRVMMNLDEFVTRE